MVIVSIVLSVLCLLACCIIIIKVYKESTSDTAIIIEQVLQTEVKNIRSDLNDGFRNNREELQKTITSFQLTFMDSLQRTASLQTQAFEKLIDKEIGRAHV